MANATDPIVSATDNGDDSVTVTHRSGIVRVLSADHPAVLNVTGGYVDGWAVGTGRGNPRHDVIHHGHVTPAGNVRSYVCGSCGVRRPATRFPTYATPRADGRTRNTAECRGCRDDRYAANRAAAAAGDAMMADAGFPATDHGDDA